MTSSASRSMRPSARLARRDNAHDGGAIDQLRAQIPFLTRVTGAEDPEHNTVRADSRLAS
ncbi:hypothetical protein GCM10010308_14940 [Streptomyces vinaceusdrappus]|nr:hypothetical protein GCM10010301_18570 [Streptomyces plicatus]GHC03439.1 hypothetical protein GCM10010308_14940 [Streptomyces vinaceusdrappus]